MFWENLCSFTSVEDQSTASTTAKITCPCCPPPQPQWSRGNVLTVFQARLTLSEVSVRRDFHSSNQQLASGFCPTLIFSVFTSSLLLFPETTKQSITFQHPYLLSVNWLEIISYQSGPHSPLTEFWGITCAGFLLDQDWLQTGLRYTS